MNRRLLVVAGVAAVLSLSGCFTLPAIPEQEAPVEAPVSAPEPVTEPVEAAPFVPDEASFLFAIEAGFVSSAVAAASETATLETGYVLCDAAADGVTHQQLVTLAQENLSDPAVFTPGMPELFVSSAEVFLCGAGA